MKSKILEAYDVNSETVNHARVKAAELRELDNRYQEKNKELKLLIQARSKLKPDLEKLERDYEKETLNNPRRMEELSVQVEELNDNIKGARRDLLDIAESIKTKDTELRKIGDGIKVKFADAMQDATRKRDEHYKIAKSYDSELLRISNMLNELNIFRPLHVFRRELPGGLQLSGPLTNEYQSWESNPYPEIQID